MASKICAPFLSGDKSVVKIFVRKRSAYKQNVSVAKNISRGASLLGLSEFRAVCLVKYWHRIIILLKDCPVKPGNDS